MLQLYVCLSWAYALIGFIRKNHLVRFREWLPSCIQATGLDEWVPHLYLFIQLFDPVTQMGGIYWKLLI